MRPDATLHQTHQGELRSLERSAAHTEAWPWWQLIGLTVVLFWVSLLVHEGAHFGTQAALRELLGPAQGARTRALTPAAGPLATVVLIVCCAFYARRAASNRQRLVAWALAVGAASRILLMAPVVVVGTGVNDETSMARAFDLPAGVFWGAEFLVAAPAMVIIYSLLPRESRARATLWIIVGVVVGWISAFTIGRAIGLPI